LIFRVWREKPPFERLSAEHSAFMQVK